MALPLWYISVAIDINFADIQRLAGHPDQLHWFPANVVTVDTYRIFFHCWDFWISDVEWFALTFVDPTAFFDDVNLKGEKPLPEMDRSIVNINLANDARTIKFKKNPARFSWLKTKSKHWLDIVLYTVNRMNGQWYTFPIQEIDKVRKTSRYRTLWQIHWCL